MYHQWNKTSRFNRWRYTWRADGDYDNWLVKISCDALLSRLQSLNLNHIFHIQIQMKRIC